jgi:hypothetical protein
VQVVTTAQAARVAGIDQRHASAVFARLAHVLDLPEARRDGPIEEWSTGSVVAMVVVRALDPHGINPERWAAGAASVGAVQARGLCPAYLVTAGGDEYGILFDGEDAERAAVTVIARVTADGSMARVVPIAPIVEHLCDVVERRASA